MRLPATGRTLPWQLVAAHEPGPIYFRGCSEAAGALRWLSARAAIGIQTTIESARDSLKVRPRENGWICIRSRNAPRRQTHLRRARFLPRHFTTGVQVLM